MNEDGICALLAARIAGAYRGSGQPGIKCLVLCAGLLPLITSF